MDPYRSQFSETVEAEPLPRELRSGVSPRRQVRLVQLARLLWVQRGVLWRVTLRGVLLAVVGSLLIPNRYTSVTLLMPPETESGASVAMMAALAGGRRGTAGTVPAGLADFLGTKNTGDLFIAILRSATVEDALINRFDLRKVYWVRYYDAARKDLASSTEISAERKSGIISIEVTDRDRVRAVAIARAYVEELDRVVAKSSTSAARRERIFLEGRLKTARQELDDAQRKFSEFASKNATLDIKEQTKAMVGAAAELEGQIIAAKSEIQGLEQLYTPNNVRVRALRERISELERQLKRLGGTAGPHPDNSTEKSSTDDTYPAIRQLPILGVPWADLYREVKVQETVYELLTEQYELARIQEAKEIPTVRVLDPPEVAERKSSPQRTVIVLIAGLLSFLLASVTIIGGHTWQQIDPSSPTKQLVQEVFAVFADLKFKLRRLRTRGSSAQ